ncbi:unnamed protein product (macronuclear) [Paramecium tetraurelia]|uniref:Uncharacterized protein n=1 Tax=Paramecium tetraurelia TaxID=5888 RepID=A0D453_PARTE|nr:uncharacterized protein GSPATT00013286001 [Paramecium tetraurelia]CAK77820.1 unnamed protein product [Paramecium tetraurelia]|eukprot:XP_001445217.1 hypothetical protein (macronuclear) [Paramecium tetraurelia strain d4-2]
MNLQVQSDIDLKLSALEKLGDNPNEVDIKYVSYILKIPYQTIHQWLEEKRVEEDFEIDISPVEDTECQFIGSGVENKGLLNKQNLVKEEDAQKKQIQISFKSPKKDIKVNEVSKIKVKINKIDSTKSSADKTLEKAQTKHINLVIRQSQQQSFEDCKTQEKSLQENQNANRFHSNKNLLQQHEKQEVSNKQQNHKGSLSQNIDIKVQQNQDQFYSQKIQKQQLNQMNNLIRLEKEKDQQGMSQIKLIEQTNQSRNEKQHKSLIVLDKEAIKQNQIIETSKIKSKQSFKKQDISNKLQTLSDLTLLSKKKAQNPVQQQQFAIRQNKMFEHGVTQQQTQQIQNKIQVNHTNQNQISQKIQHFQQNQDHNSLQVNQQQPVLNFTEERIINSNVESHEQLNKQQQQVEQKTSNSQHQNMTQPPEKLDHNLPIESLKLQQQPQIYQVCTSQLRDQTNPTNQSSLQCQRGEVQPQNDSEANPLQTQSSQITQGCIQQEYMDKMLQLPNQVEMIQIFNYNQQVLGQVIKLITTVSNQQFALMQKLDLINQCVNKK